MAPKTQLQRALLDAASVLSSAANIARVAARSLDGESLARGGGSEVKASGFNATSTSRPWPSASRTEASPSSTPWPSQIVEAPRAIVVPQKVRPAAPPNPHVAVKEDVPSRDPSTPPILTRVDHKPVEKNSENVETRSPPAAEPEGPSSTNPALALESTENNLESNLSIKDSKLAEDTPVEEYDATIHSDASPIRASKVPSSQIARLFHYGSLGAGLAWGAAGSYIRRGVSGTQDEKQFMSDDNVRRLVDKLSTMRGAALKLGQFMSIQDSNLLPEQIEQVMMRLQNSAHYMPQWQMEKVMQADLGPDWRGSFDEFDDVPFASASIGQVHSATLSRTLTHPLAGKRVAVKVQFPGVRQSIKSDLSNLRWLLTASAILPPGLFLQNTLRVMERELDDECDYEREREMCERFAQLLNGKSEFAVPLTVPDLCTAHVLTTEMMKGRPLTQAARYPQKKRDAIARSILSLSLRELFTFRLMQTDPNWSNFLYNELTGKLELIDFGATREYSKEFMDDFLRMLRAAISGDRSECVHWSEKIGYLTGEEKETMRNAHVDSMIALAEPFKPTAPDPYPFAGQTITDRVRAQVPLMLRERLTPPPEPTYSLNRKLSGAFLLCARLKANVSCRGLFEEVTSSHALGQQWKATPFSAPDGIRRVHTRRSRLGDLANRWPRHVQKAVEASLQDGPPDKQDGSYLTLASQPAAASMQDVPADVNLRKEPSVAAEAVINFRGVAVPIKPSPPGAEDCCMSGCAVCVYDLYADDLRDYRESLTVAREKILNLDPPLKDSEWDTSILGPRPSRESASDTRTAEERVQQEVDDLIGQLDPSMKAFLQLERSLKQKKQKGLAPS